MLIGDSMQTFSTERAVLTFELIVGIGILGVRVLFQFVSRARASG